MAAFIEIAGEDPGTAIGIMESDKSFLNSNRQGEGIVLQASPMTSPDYVLIVGNKHLAEAL